MTGPRTDLWTSEREQQLLELVAVKQRIVDIARELGVSRNAIVGKLARMRRNGRIFETHWQWHERPKYEPVRRRSPRPRIKPPPKEPPPMSRPPEPYEPRLVPAFPMRQLSLMELGDRTCRWPVGNPGEPGFFFCGNETALDHSYCPVHHRIAHG